MVKACLCLCVSSFVHGLASKGTKQNVERRGAYGGDEEANGDSLLCARHCCGYIIQLLVLVMLYCCGC